VNSHRAVNMQNKVRLFPLPHGERLAYRLLGQGEMVVFGHPFLCHGGAWHEQAQAIKTHYRCLLPDFWGHGQSSLSGQADPLALKRYALGVLALLDTLGVNHFTLVGAGLGGLWVSELAKLAPHRVRGVILMDTFLGSDPVSLRDDCLRLMQADSPVSCESWGGAVTSLNYLQQQWRRLSPRRQIGLFKIGEALPLRESRQTILRALSLPILFTVGEWAGQRPLADTKAMFELAEHGIITVIPHAGHFSHLDNPQYVSTLLLAFLDDMTR